MCCLRRLHLFLSGVVLIGVIYLPFPLACCASGNLFESSSDWDGVLHCMSKLGSESEKFHFNCWSSIGRLRIFLSKSIFFMLVYDKFLLFWFVTMLLVCVLGFLSKYASTVVTLVLQLEMSIIFSMFADILMASVPFDHCSSMLIAASLLFNV